VPGRAACHPGDLFETLPRGRRYAVITANPPWVPDGTELPDEVINHEPVQSFFGGPDGLDVVRRIIREIPEWLLPAGVYAQECDPTQVEKVCGLLAAAGLRETRAHVIFTAHSLPARILESGDPYRDQLLETAQLVADRAGGSDWSFSFQSESPTGEPWLGPDILDHLEALHRQGVESVLVCPVGFVSDHLEIRWDLDVEAQEKAAELGMKLERIEMPNADPAFIRVLAGLVRRIAPDLVARSVGTPAENDAFLRAEADDGVRVDDAARYGRGGLLPMAVFLTRNSPGLRTSPVKRGYWVVRGVLGAAIAVGVMSIARTSLLPKLIVALPFLPLGSAAVNDFAFAVEFGQAAAFIRTKLNS